MKDTIINKVLLEKKKGDKSLNERVEEWQPKMVDDQKAYHEWRAAQGIYSEKQSLLGIDKPDAPIGPVTQEPKYKTMNHEEVTILIINDSYFNKE